MSRLPRFQVVTALALVTLGALAACPSDSPSNPHRLWLDAQQEGGTASLSAEEPPPY